MTSARPDICRLPKLIVKQPFSSPRDYRLRNEVGIGPFPRQIEAQSILRVDVRQSITMPRVKHWAENFDGWPATQLVHHSNGVETAQRTRLELTYPSEFVCG